MSLNFSIEDLALFLIALIAVFSPFAVMSPFIAITKGLSEKIRRRVAFRTSLYSTLILILTVWVGDLILRFLGISVDALASAGGVVLILTSIPMIMVGKSQGRRTNSEDVSGPDEGWESLVVTPLVFPLSVGAGGISLVITEASLVSSIWDRFALTGVIVVDGLFMLATYVFAVPLSARKGGRGSTIVTRIGGIILLSIAMKILTDGLKGLLPGLS